MSTVDRVRELIEPLVTEAGVELYDLEHEGGVLRAFLDQEGGIDVDVIGEVAHQISLALDHSDPLPNERYLLEVSSPGIERRLRVPRHFQSQVGSEVTLKVHPGLDVPRRFQGTLVAADDDGFEVEQLQSDGPIRHRVAYGDVESARTVFQWDDNKSTATTNSNKKA